MSAPDLATALSSPLAAPALAGAWLTVRCHCAAVTKYPVRLLARQLPGATVADAAAEICCKICRGWPAVMLDERGDVGVFGGPSAYGSDGWRVELLRAMETDAAGSP